MAVDVVDDDMSILEEEKRDDVVETREGRE
jgi:hypothetical protein